MIELYAITDATGPPLPDVSFLRATATRHLAGVYAPAVDEDVTPELLWRRERVIEALMSDRDVLPVRYGTRVQDETAIIRLLESRYELLAESLEFVRGAAEVSVRAYAAHAPATTPEGEGRRSGSEYLRLQARAVAAERAAVCAVHEPLAARARAATLRQARAPAELVRAAYLLDHADVARFGAHVAELQDHNAHLRLVCTGPWPPYSFAQR